MERRSSLDADGAAREFLMVLIQQPGIEAGDVWILKAEELLEEVIRRFVGCFPVAGDVGCINDICYKRDQVKKYWWLF